MDNLPDDEEEGETRNGISSSASHSSSGTDNSSEWALSKEISHGTLGARPKTLNEVDDNSSERALSKEISHGMLGARPETLNEVDGFLQEPDNLVAGVLEWLYDKHTDKMKIFSKVIENGKQYEVVLNPSKTEGIPP